MNLGWPPWLCHTILNIYTENNSLNLEFTVSGVYYRPLLFLYKSIEQVVSKLIITLTTRFHKSLSIYMIQYFWFVIVRIDFSLVILTALTGFDKVQITPLSGVVSLWFIEFWCHLKLIDWNHVIRTDRELKCWSKWNKYFLSIMLQIVLHCKCSQTMNTFVRL